MFRPEVGKTASSPGCRKMYTDSSNYQKIPMRKFFTNGHAVYISPLSIVVTIATLLGLFLLFQIRSIIALLFLSYIFMTALRPMVEFLMRKLRVPQPVSIIIVYVSVMTILIGMLSVILPPLGTELYQLLRTVELPFLQEELSTLRFTVSELGQLADSVGNSFGVVMTLINSTFTGVFTVFTLLVMSYYLMVDRDKLHQKIGWFSHERKHHDQAERFFATLDKQLGGWIRGQIILMVLIGVITYVGLSIIGVPYALPLALLAGLLEIVPNLGPTLAALPAIALAFLGGGGLLAGFTVVFYLVVQQLENNIIVPRVMKSNADVNPLVAIVAILIGLKLAGVVGALLAVPAYIVVRSVYAVWIKHS